MIRRLIIVLTLMTCVLVRGQSVSWDTGTDGIYATHATLLDTVPTEITVCSWVRHTDTFDSGRTDDVHIWHKTNKNTSPYDIWQTYWEDADGTLVFSKFGASASADSIVTSQTSWNAGEWYFIVHTYCTTGCIPQGTQLYVNGNQVGSNGSTKAVRDGSTRDFGLAVSTFGGTPTDTFDGVIDGFRIYYRVLTDGEIADLYVSRYAAGPNDYEYAAGTQVGKSNGDTITIVPDATGRGIDLTVTGSATVSEGVTTSGTFFNN